MWEAARVIGSVEPLLIASFMRKMRRTKVQAARVLRDTGWANKTDIIFESFKSKAARDSCQRLRDDH